MAHSMWTKFTKYWDVIHHILVIAVVLDPRYKLEIVEFYAEKFGSAYCGFSVESVKHILCELVVEYQSRSSGSGSSALASNDFANCDDNDFELFVTQRKKSCTTVILIELDNYLNEDVLPRTSDFYILLWWKLSGPKYPILQAIARDVLAILVTSVASESAFSSGGLLIDHHRSKLHITTVKAFMCTRSWLMDNRGS
ncbi:Putative AC transposase [Linum perenne]